MATNHRITADDTQAVRSAAALLADVAWIPPDEAAPLASLAEALANMATVLAYHTSTGEATPEDFEEAAAALQAALAVPEPVPEVYCIPDDGTVFDPPDFICVGAS